ncbi:MAG TPA: protein translocase subunit SecF [Spongiibacteraceae bacterium]|nr:protein translocase subunit SecF [Spongiibacteraceae bacterium]HUH37697.1 protein translocase subunit SecF [Spongiibacteraceae bacterium]
MAEAKVINFMKLRRVLPVFSLLIILASVVEVAIDGIKFGLDFTGGTLVELHYSDSIDLQDVRETLARGGYPQAVVVHFGADSDVLIRLQESDSAKLGEQLVGLLRADFDGEVDLRRAEFVGPQVGEQLREQGGLAMLLALGAVLIYIAFRFQLKFGIGAVFGLIHDVVIVLGLFALFDWEFDLTVLAALLAVIGYSINDTIVVFDRIRENFRKLRKTEVLDVINISLTETLDRTLATSFTTLLVLIALWVFGGDMIHGFATALIIGIVVGTYSSIYVASNILLLLNISRDDLMVPIKEGAEADSLP